MKQLKSYININKNRSRITDNDDYPDERKPRFHKDGTPYLWWRAYKLLINEGPMSKAEILKRFGLKETSYNQTFARLSKQNIIVPNKHTKKLEPKKYSEWKL